jgi:hypothetical protein
MEYNLHDTNHNTHTFKSNQMQISLPFPLFVHFLVVLTLLSYSAELDTEPPAESSLFT